MPSVLVIGLGEIGRPLLEVLSGAYMCHGKDVGPLEIAERIDVMHVCYPYEIGDFVGTTLGYIARYAPDMTIIHSTVVPGTTRTIYRESQRQVVYSPMRGKHATMKADLLSYTKYVASPVETATRAAVEHLNGCGLRVAEFSSPEALELAKLVETTYFGLLIAWAQDIQRFCRSCSADFGEVMKFTGEIDYLPPVVFQPGYIGGHCVIPNTHLLERVRSSRFIDIIRESNEQRREEYVAAGRSPTERLSPTRIRPSDMQAGHE